MIYAILADAHGNHAALEAVISDAKAKGAKGYLLLGDYIRDTPKLNEVVDTIRNLPNCTAILGNGDKGRQNPIRFVCLSKLKGRLKWITNK